LTDESNTRSFDFEIAKNEQSLFLLTYPKNDSAEWNFNITLSSVTKYLQVSDLASNDTGSYVDTPQEAAQNSAVFWSLLIQFAAFMTFFFTMLIIFILLHDWDKESEFATRRRLK